MQSKNAIANVHAVAGVRSMHKLYVCVIWNAGVEVEYMLHNEYYCLLLVHP